MWHASAARLPRTRTSLDSEMLDGKTETEPTHPSREEPAGRAGARQPPGRAGNDVVMYRAGDGKAQLANPADASRPAGER
jgi:hypothetical protein